MKLVISFLLGWIIGRLPAFIANINEYMKIRSDVDEIELDKNGIQIEEFEIDTYDDED